MAKRYPYQLNVVIAVSSIVTGIMYLGLTLPYFIKQLECATCGDVTMLAFEHYWYRWCLYSLLVLAGYRLFARLLGARRLYYVFFAGASAVAVLDIINNFSMMTKYDVTLDFVMPVIVSVVGIIYFRRHYRSTLKYR